MDADTGDVTVIHPKFVARPVGDACDSGVTLDATNTTYQDTAYQGDGKWCYSDFGRRTDASGSRVVPPCSDVPPFFANV